MRRVLADWRAALVAFLCSYEVVAIFLSRTGYAPPTITAVCHRLRTHQVGRLGLWLALGWLIEHLFGEGREAMFAHPDREYSDSPQTTLS